ncbi:MAG: adenylate/guanylate cyclase domain-containing protein [Rhodospirillales bacterium]
MRLPLRITITTAFTVLTMITVSTVAAVNFYGNQKAIYEAAQNGIASSAGTAEREVNLLLNRAFVAADTIAALPRHLLDWQTPDPLLSALTISMKTSPEIYGVFVGFPDGAFVQAINLLSPDGSRRIVNGMPAEAVTAWRIILPEMTSAKRLESWRFFDKDRQEITTDADSRIKEATYDPRTRPWFINAQAEKKPVISRAYVFASLLQPGVTVAQPLYSYPTATVGVDLSLNDLSGLAKRLQPRKNGVVAILDKDSQIVGYPDMTKTVAQSDTESGLNIVSAAGINDRRIQKAVVDEPSTRNRHLSFSIDGKSYIGYINHSSDDNYAGWKVISVADVEDYTGPLMTTLYHSLLIAAVIMVIAVTGVAAMAGWITLPVIRLRQMADQVTTLNFGDIKSFDSPFEEIKRLQSSMDRMRAALDTFLRFVPRDVVRELIKSSSTASIGGTRREVTLLFTDIEGFTTISEKMTPEQIMSQTSEYFENMSFGIQANRGTIDKFIGDAIMAIWNAPIDDAFHVDNACRGVLAAHHISEDLNKEFAAKGLATLRTRFGLHTCDVLVGNIGARDRMQYTCLGSGVNLAARIEGLNKFYGTQVLASDTVRRKASSDFLFRRVDIVEAKGTTQPLTIYELMGERGEDAAFYVGKETMQLASKYEQAFDFYLHRDFSDALFILDQLAESHPDDAVVAQLRVKCRNFMETPPAAEWNGATVLDKK